MANETNLKGFVQNGSDVDKQLRELAVKSLKDNGYSNVAKTIEERQMSFPQMTEFIQQNGNQNTLAGSIFGFIAKQFVKAYDMKSIYGDIFQEGEAIDIGSGFSYIETINNMIGTSNPINYQTSTQTAGTIAYGESFSNGYFINITVQNLPINQIASGFNNWITLNVTIPMSWTSFSGLTAVKAGEILSLYEKNMANSLKIYYYTLGNQLFNYFISNNYFNNVINANSTGVANAKSQGITYAAPTNLQEALQQEIIPMLEYFQQLHFALNLGFSANNGNSWGTNAEGQGNSYVDWIEVNQGQQSGNWNYNAVPWYTYNTQNTVIPNLKASSKDDLVIFMSVRVSSAIKALIASNYLGAGSYDIEFNGNKVSSLCGIRVVVVGSNIQLPTQVTQGQMQTTGTMNTPLISDNQIVIMEKDALTYHKFYEKHLQTDTFVASMVQVAREQIAYLPFLNQWKQGVIMEFNPGILTAQQYLSVKQISA